MGISSDAITRSLNLVTFMSLPPKMNMLLHSSRIDRSIKSSSSNSIGRKYVACGSYFAHSSTNESIRRSSSVSYYAELESLKASTIIAMTRLRYTYETKTWNMPKKIMDSAGLPQPRGPPMV